MGPSRASLNEALSDGDTDAAAAAAAAASGVSVKAMSGLVCMLEDWLMCGRSSCFCEAGIC